MFNRFSNEPTNVVFEALANDPDAYERLQYLCLMDPARVVDEIRTFAHEKVVPATEGPQRDLAEAALRMVRWAEIRTALQH